MLLKRDLLERLKGREVVIQPGNGVLSIMSWNESQMNSVHAYEMHSYRIIDIGDEVFLASKTRRAFAGSPDLNNEFRPIGKEIYFSISHIYTIE